MHSLRPEMALFKHKSRIIMVQRDEYIENTWSFVSEVDIFLLFWMSNLYKRCRQNSTSKFNSSCPNTILAHYNSGQGLTHITVDFSPSEQEGHLDLNLGLIYLFAKVRSLVKNALQCTKVQCVIMSELRYKFSVILPPWQPCQHNPLIRGMITSSENEDNGHWDKIILPCISTFLLLNKTVRLKKNKKNSPSLSHPNLTLKCIQFRWDIQNTVIYTVYPLSSN